jgi:Protein of unknown function (DUF1592)/Protein of unknown function (DUF1588)/Protein of unknown function (DUF1587)/Protein of unknown function (DUF1595)/Protein of unknown function (DUF1585)/Planctomycete cytochrome C
MHHSKSLWMALATAFLFQNPVFAQSDQVAFHFDQQIKPLFEKYCTRCHTADHQESGIRVDNLTSELADRQLFLIKDVRKQIESGEMPPADEPQLAPDESKRITEWVDQVLVQAKKQNTQRNGAARRLTVSQYRNTLRDLLGLQEDLTDTLPPDGISKDGFTNNAHAMILSPLQVESYLEIAAAALDRSIVDERSRPTIQNFRMDLGKAINVQPCPDKLVLGANSLLLENSDFIVSEPRPTKPFEFDPFAMRVQYDFIEGYAGNDTVRGWRQFDSIYHSVFACLRGTPGYPKGEAYEVVERGLLLRPAIPSTEIFGQENTYGPKANFKISLRELPEVGNFQVRVQAARYDDGLLLDAGDKSLNASESSIHFATNTVEPATSITIAEAGIYQIDVYHRDSKHGEKLQLKLGDRSFAGQLQNHENMAANASDNSGKEIYSSAFLLVRLAAGELPVSAAFGKNPKMLDRLRFHPIEESSPLGERFKRFEKRIPTLGVYVGLRRDCGSTLTQVGKLQAVRSESLDEYSFQGAIADFPSPDVEKDNVNYLAGIREIGVRSEYTDGRDVPRLLIRSIEFEGPYHDQWPPASHRSIFIDSPLRGDSEAYARTVIDQFASRAFRRPVTPDESTALLNVWRKSFAEQNNFVQSVKDALIVALTAPQFLFIVENSSGPDSEDLDEYELASKLAYFLWNTAPDHRLLELAKSNLLRNSIDAEIDRMVADARFADFAQVFTSEWLNLDKFDVVSIDAKQFPQLTRDAKIQLRQEPIELVQYLFRHNLSARNLVQSDFIMANEVVANYYGLTEATETGFEFVSLQHRSDQLGGVLSQAAIMAGLSNGRQPNPVKRGAWLARKIVAEPPDDPPPNVPLIKDDDGSSLSLRQKLENHRNQKGCAKCHSGIDPWGIPLESFNAAGRFTEKPNSETRSQLPDGTEVQDFQDLRAHLANERLDQVAFSLMKHLASFATGRTLTYSEIVFLQEKGIELKSRQYPARDILHLIIRSDLFQKK